MAIKLYLVSKIDAFTLKPNNMAEAMVHDFSQFDNNDNNKNQCVTAIHY
jgi:hypothetical protein